MNSNTVKTGIGILAATLAMNCSDDNLVSAKSEDIIRLNDLTIDSINHNTGYLKATVDADGPSQVYAAITEADTLFASKRAYANPSAEIEFSNLKVPMDGRLMVANGYDTIFVPFVLQPDTGIADTNGTVKDTVVADTTSNNPTITDSTMDGPDTTVTDSSMGGSEDTTDTNQSYYKKLEEKQSCLDRLIQPNLKNVRVAHNLALYYKPRQYTRS